ncbi:hypothetical protein H4218_005136 [Coemansia sp. IMI 209128]|nr:hypothetical protein H4218_005136 [Coemansia sp. IMI 209128]
MVCAICYEPYFRPLPKSKPGCESASSAAASLFRLVALGCGHVFHKKCVDSWFASNKARRCAQCNVAHAGTPAVLYIDMDDDDCVAVKSTLKKDEASKKSTGDSSSGKTNMQELALGMSCMGIFNKSGEYYAASNLAKHNSRLEKANSELATELEEASRSLDIERTLREDENADHLRLELREERNVRQKKETALRKMNVYLQHELLEVARLSKENNKLKEQTRVIDKLMRELEANSEVIDAYEDKFGPYQPSDFSRFSHGGAATNQAKRSRKF